MTTISNLPFTRFVMQVSTGAPQIKSNWKAMQASNLETLKSPIWREVSTKDASLVDHDFTKSSHINDSYDAFQMTGNYNSTAMTEIAYAGMVAYRFKLPDDYYTGNANITSISVPVYRDRFCKGGIHVAALFGGNIPTNFTWDNVRGTRGTAMPPKVAMMAQSDEATPYLTASSAADDVATFAVNPVVNKSRYLWIILTIEDYEDGWEWYNKKEKRFYAIEGSARLGGDMLSVEFDSDVTPDVAEHEYAIIRGGVVPRLPEGSASGARVLELQRDGTPFVPNWIGKDTTPGITNVFVGNMLVRQIFGTIYKVNYSIPFRVNGGAKKRIVVVSGAITESTYGLRGVLILDADTGQKIDGTAVTYDSSFKEAVEADIASLTCQIGVRIFIDNDGNGSEVAKAYLYAVKFVRSGSDAGGNLRCILRASYFPFLEINLSTRDTTLARNMSFLSSWSDDQISDGIYKEFINYSQADGTGTAPNYGGPLSIFFVDHGVFKFWAQDSGLGTEYYFYPYIACTYDLAPSFPHLIIEGRDKFVVPEVNEIYKAIYGASSSIFPNHFFVLYKGNISDFCTSDEAFHFDGTQQEYHRIKILISGDMESVKPRGSFDVSLDPLDCTGCSLICVGKAEIVLDVNSYDDPETFISLLRIGDLNNTSDLVVMQSDANDEVYNVLGNFTAVDGDASLRYGYSINAASNVRTSLGMDTRPLAYLSNGFRISPEPGDNDIPYYLAENLSPAYSAEDEAIGLRTLRGRFYLDGMGGVSRETRERLGAAFSVRAGTAQFMVVRYGTTGIEHVPVWRMSATALVIPFAVPTEWRAKTLRLDWTGWTGTATAGAQFNVWLRAGHWQDSCPQVLESDIPYDALKAEADGWMLLGRVDAMLSGSNRTASFDIAGLIGSEKIASLMLTAYASTDGINPGANTEWPVGAATEVDVVDGDIVNADKAWLPNVTLIG